jgi:hypothetical protein
MAIQLSARGRQSFGEWTANTLRLAAGGLFGAVVVPGLLGRPVPSWAAYGAALLGIAMAFIGVAIYYLTTERAGESSQ